MLFKSPKKIIGIMGATGKQGGATVRAFNVLKESGNNEYQLRAITRDPSSDRAQAITSLVDEVVKADAKDVDSLVEAFKGCYGVYIVSNFWEDMNVVNEMTCLRNCKEALKQVKDVKHIVVSSFEDTRDFVANAANKDTWKYPEHGIEVQMYAPHSDGKV